MANKVKHRFIIQEHFSLARATVILVISVVIAALLASQIIGPAKQKIAERYLLRGDSYFASQNFDQAILEYQKGIDFDSNNLSLSEHLALVKKAKTDIASARIYFAAHGVTSVVELIDESKKQYQNPKDALAAGAKLYQDGEYPYAQYPLELSVELDPGYAEAWHYLALDYQKLAQIDKGYATKATAAITKQNQLTPNYLEDF